MTVPDGKDFRVEVEYLGGDIRPIAKILAKGLYDLLKKQGRLRVDPQRKARIQQAIDEAREIMHRIDSA